MTCNFKVIRTLCNWNIQTNLLKLWSISLHKFVLSELNNEKYKASNLLLDNKWIFRADTTLKAYKIN